MFSFGKYRKAAGRQDDGIDYLKASSLLVGDTPLPAAFRALDAEYDFVIADFATGYGAEIYHAMMQSDRILVPTAIADEELSAATTILQSIEDYGFDIPKGQTFGLSLNRLEPIPTMTSKLARRLFQLVVEGGFPCFDARLSMRHAYRNIMDHRLFLHEFDPSFSKSTAPAIAEVEALVSAVLEGRFVDPSRAGLPVTLNTLGSKNDG